MSLPLILITVFAIILLQHFGEGIIARPLPFHELDENGNLTPPIFLRGDESFHWEEDENGYTIIDDPTYIGKGRRTRKVYADFNPITGQLFNTGLVLGSSNVTKKRLKEIAKHVKPSLHVRRSKCGDYCDNTISKGQSRHLSENDNNERNYQEHKNRRKLMSSQQSLKNLAVLLRFQNHKDRILPSPSDFHVLLNGPGGYGTVAPTGSVNDVFLANSYGKFSFNSTVYPWITLSKTEDYYADRKSGIGPKIFEALREALNVIDADPSIDLTEFNTDNYRGDPFIDSITFFHSGHGAEWGGTDCYGTIQSKRIWSHNWFMYSGAWTSSDGTVTVSNYNINPGVWDVCGSAISRVGVVAHEAAHFLGLPDLYDPLGGEGVGVYDLMADSWGVDASQLYPPMLSPWSKIELGWLTHSFTSGKGDYTLRQSWQYPEVYKIQQGYQSNEYLLIENRQPGSFDALLPRGGIAIWHVDESQYLDGNSVEGYPGQAGWPANNKHYQVALLQADGKYDLERGVNNGDFSDLFRFDFYNGVDFLFPSNSDPMIGPFPNTDYYGQGRVGRTNHFISGISGPGPNMQFSLLPSSPCQPQEVHFELSLLTDTKGSEVSWLLSESSTGDIVLSGGNYSSNSLYSKIQCLPAICYTFLIMDSGGDGICCEYGSGSYSIRLNGWKLASGNSYGNREEISLRCLMPPTTAPTVSPIEPSVFPSIIPSSYPSYSVVPTFISTKDACISGKIRLEVITEGEEFDTEIIWNVKDVHGNKVIDNLMSQHKNGYQMTQECIPRDSCYTFSIHDSIGNFSLGNDNQRGQYTIKLGGDTLASGSNFRSDQYVMFGDACLGHGETICSTNAYTKSLFRLEFVSQNDGRHISWKLTNSDKDVLVSAGPFGDCTVNSFAVCLPLLDCYEFITTMNDARVSSSPGGMFTGLFSEMEGGMIQSYNGTFLSGVHRIFFGTCYSMNFQ